MVSPIVIIIIIVVGYQNRQKKPRIGPSVKPKSKGHVKDHLTTMYSPPTRCKLGCTPRTRHPRFQSSTDLSQGLTSTPTDPKWPHPESDVDHLEADAFQGRRKARTAKSRIGAQRSHSESNTDHHMRSYFEISAGPVSAATLQDKRMSKNIATLKAKLV